MGGSYRQCPECGKRALSIATRCPGCGREFPTPAAPDSAPTLDLGRFRSPKAMAAALVVAVILAVRVGGASRLPTEQSSLPLADSLMLSSEVAYARTAARRADTSGASESAGELLLARDWTSVRKARSRRADLEAILMPGDTVLADSLVQGWYRVALLGEVLGYAHRSTLTTPAAADPFGD